MATFFIACNSNDENQSNNENDEEVENKAKDLYQIGETAQVNHLISSATYEVTVHNFELAKE